MKACYSNQTAPNRYQRREGYTLTPLMAGKIQYGKMLKKDNMDAVREELTARSLSYDIRTGWKEMINLLKKHENETNQNARDKYCKPLTNYANFVASL